MMRFCLIIFLNVSPLAVGHPLVHILSNVHQLEQCLHSQYCHNTHGTNHADDLRLFALNQWLLSIQKLYDHRYINVTGKASPSAPCLWGTPTAVQTIKFKLTYRRGPMQRIACTTCGAHILGTRYFVVYAWHPGPSEYGH